MQMAHERSPDTFTTMPGVHEEIKSNIPDPHFRIRDTRLSGLKKFQPKGHGKFTLRQ